MGNERAVSALDVSQTAVIDRRYSFFLGRAERGAERISTRAGSEHDCERSVATEEQASRACSDDGGPAQGALAFD